MKCWIRVVDSQGAGYKGSTATRVTVDDDAIIDDLRDAVKLRHPQIPTTIGPSQLTVFKSVDDIHNSQPLKGSFTISGLGYNEDEALVVVVPDSHPPDINGLM